MDAFLDALGEVAGSPLAFVAYAFVLVVWLARAWLVYRPRARAQEILGQFADDKQRIAALATIVGEMPPPGLPKAKLIEWVTIKSKEKTRILFFAAFVATLATVLAITALAVYAVLQREEPKAVDELRVRDKEAAAFELGSSKVIYSQLHVTLRYRLAERRDSSWLGNPAIDTVQRQMTDMLSNNRQLYCVLEEYPCSVSAESTWEDIFIKLDPMLRRQYVGRVQNAYNLGQLIGVLQIEVIMQPGGGVPAVPILLAYAADTARIWVNGETILPPNASLRASVRDLYNYAKRNEAPPAAEFQRLVNPIRAYYSAVS